MAEFISSRLCVHASACACVCPHSCPSEVGGVSPSLIQLTWKLCSMSEVVFHVRVVRNAEEVASGIRGGRGLPGTHALLIRTPDCLRDVPVGVPASSTGVPDIAPLVSLLVSRRSPGRGPLAPASVPVGVPPVSRPVPRTWARCSGLCPGLCPPPGAPAVTSCCAAPRKYCCQNMFFALFVCYVALKAGCAGAHMMGRGCALTIP